MGGRSIHHSPGCSLTANISNSAQSRSCFLDPSRNTVTFVLFASSVASSNAFLQNAGSIMNVSIRCILAATFLVLISCASIQHAKAEVKEGVRIERDLSYVPDGDSSQRLDLYVPDKGD